MDFSAGALIPFYDHDTRTVYLAGKVRERESERPSKNESEYKYKRRHPVELNSMVSIKRALLNYYCLCFVFEQKKMNECMKRDHVTFQYEFLFSLLFFRYQIGHEHDCCQSIGYVSCTM